MPSWVYADMFEKLPSFDPIGTAVWRGRKQEDTTVEIVQR